MLGAQIAICALQKNVGDLTFQLSAQMGNSPKFDHVDQATKKSLKTSKDYEKLNI